MSDVYRWTGDTDGDVNKPGNYDDGLGGAVGTIPQAGDELYLTYGAVDIDTNLGQLASTLLSKVVQTPDYEGNIGADTPAYLELQAKNFYLDAYAESAHYFDLALTQDNDDDQVRVDGTGTIMQLTGTIPTLNITAGTVTLASVTCATFLNIEGSPTLTIDSGSTISGATIICKGGTTTSSAAFTTLSLQNGTWVQRAGNGTTVHIYGGEFRYNVAQGRVELVNVIRGLLNCADDPNPKVIGRIRLYDNGRVDLDNGGVNIPVENGIEFIGEGNVKFPRGARVMCSPIEIP